eukprot:jgi/Ulvmu1/6982/UM033_0040.1
MIDAVSDPADSDVEEDPFAEFTVMDGLEDLDDMLADKGGSAANVSHGMEASESLATGAVASMQQDISDAQQSEPELPGPASDMKQPVARCQGALDLAQQQHSIRSVWHQL